MKPPTLCLLVLIALLSVCADHAFGQWFWQNPLPQGNSLNDVYTFENGTSIAVGDAGTILRIDASGQIHDIRQNVCGQEDPFWCVFFNTPQTGWIGGSGLVLKSVDGGNTWHEADIDSSVGSVPVNDVSFVDEKIGWLRAGTTGWWGYASGRLYKTEDGGDNWICVNPHIYWIDIHFLNADTGYGIAYGSEFLHRTVDDGITWDTVSRIAQGLQSLSFLNDSTGWIGTSSGIWRTSDGLSWQQTASGVDCKDIYFQNHQIGWAIIDEDSIIHTVNGGIDWTGQSCLKAAPVKLNAFEFNNQGYGVCVGSFGHIRVKEDSSNDWQALNKSSMYGNITGIHALSEKNVWLCGVEYSGVSNPNEYGYEYFASALLHTVDGGEHWEKTIFQDAKAVYGLTDIFFSNPQHGWVIGNCDYNGPNVIKHTSDGGATWLDQDCGLSWVELKQILFVDSLYGWIVGSEWSSQPRLFTTQDGGNSWRDRRYNVPYNLSVYDIEFIDRNRGWLVGSEGANSHGEIHLTTNGGDSWIKIKSKANSYTYFNSIQFFDSLNGWVSSFDSYQGSQLEYTNDGGTTWHTSLVTGYDTVITDMCFLNEKRRWLLVRPNSYSQYPAFIYQTENGGVNWRKGTPIQTTTPDKIDFADAYTGWVVGGSAIVKTTDGGITFVKREEQEDKSPTQFLLLQNYPNPFNPSTTITYELPKSSEVRLSVYDMLGREVSVLVNEKREVGVHEVKLDASNLSSGVYFYRLEAGDFVQSRKLVFLK